MVSYILLLISLSYGFITVYSFHSHIIINECNGKDFYIKLHLKQSKPFCISNKYKSSMIVSTDKNEIQHTNHNNQRLIAVFLGIMIPIVYFSFEIFKYFLSSIPLLLFIGVTGCTKLIYDNIKKNELVQYTSTEIRTAIVDSNIDSSVDFIDNIIQVTDNVNNEIQITDSFEVGKKRSLKQLQHILSVESKDNQMIQNKLEKLQQNIYLFNNRIKEML